jgi:lipooligosaccharide transport system permease protein
VASITFTSAIAGDTLHPRRAMAVTSRNMVLFGSAGGYWLLMLSGFAEPVLYLFAIGWGVGSLVGTVHVGARALPYLTFLAPALLATSAMNGAFTEASANFFVRMRSQKLYDSVLNTPVAPVEIAFGELSWAIMRSAVYTAGFVLVMALMGLTTPLRALAVLPAALLAGLAFAALGLALATLMRSWADYEYISVAQFALFLFSGTFVPMSAYPAVLRALVPLTPLYHAVALIRGITLGQLGWGSAVNLAYLVTLTVVSLAVAARRVRRLLRK